MSGFDLFPAPNKCGDEKETYSTKYFFVVGGGGVGVSGEEIQRCRRNVSTDVLHVHVAQAVCKQEDLLIFKAAPQSRWKILAVKLPPSLEQIPLLPQGDKRIKTRKGKKTQSHLPGPPSALDLLDSTGSLLSSLTLSPAFFPPESEVPCRHYVTPQMLPDRKSPLLTLQTKQHCAEVFELLFACVCVCVCLWVCVCTSPWKYVQAYRVSTEDWVSERKLIIPPSVVFWLSWRSRYSLVLLFSVLQHSRTPYMKHSCRPHCPGCSSVAASEELLTGPECWKPI